MYRLWVGKKLKFGHTYRCTFWQAVASITVIEIRTAYFQLGFTNSLKSAQRHLCRSPAQGDCSFPSCSAWYCTTRMQVMDECLDVLWHPMFTLKGMLVKSSGTAAGSFSKRSVALLSSVYYTAGKIIISQMLFRIDCCHFCSWQAEQIEASPIMSKGLRAGEGNYCKSRVWKFIGYLHTAWFVFSFSGVNVQNLSVTNLLICWFIQQFSPCNELISRVWNGK